MPILMLVSLLTEQRITRESCVKELIVLNYATISSDTVTLNVSQARVIMQQVTDVAKKELDVQCRSKAKVRLGTVHVSGSSGYTINGTLEYLINPEYGEWDFATCVASANLLNDLVLDPKKAPAVPGQYSSYNATNVRKPDSAGLSVAATCCNPGSVLKRTSCGNVSDFFVT